MKITRKTFFVIGLFRHRIPWGVRTLTGLGDAYWRGGPTGPGARILMQHSVISPSAKAEYSHTTTRFFATETLELLKSSSLAPRRLLLTCFTPPYTHEHSQKNACAERQYGLPSLTNPVTVYCVPNRPWRVGNFRRSSRLLFASFSRNDSRNDYRHT